MNRVPNDRDNSFNEVDFLRYTVVNRSPDTDKEVLDTRPDDCEKVLDCVEDGAYEVLYTVPYVDEKVLDARPNAYQEFLYFSKIGAENTADHIQRIFQRILDEIPYRSKDALDAAPHSAPVAGKDTDENIQNTQDNVCHSLEDICDLLELPLKDLPPLFGSRGYAFSVFLTDRFLLSEVIGKTVIIHENSDDFTSQPSGNAAEKLACGVVKSCNLQC